MPEKTIFSSIDMRNAKYQGITKNNQPNGLGFLFNIQHTLILSTWKNQQPSGNSLIVYPNRNYLYGKISKKKLQGLCVYQKGNGEVYYFKCSNGVVDKIARDQNNGLVTELISNDGKLQVGVSEKIEGINKWDTIGRIIGQDVPLKMKGVRNFIKEGFQKQYGDIIEYSQSSGLTFLRFKNKSSLGLKFDRKDRIVQVGMFESFPQNIQFGRKYIFTHNKSIKTQQGRYQKPQKLYQYQKKRPLQAIKQTEQYFKCGTNFQNIFFKTTVLEQIDHDLSNIQKNISELSMLQYGQKILQREKPKEEEYYENRRYQLQEVKKDIYSKVDKINHTGRTSKGGRSDWQRQDVLTPRKVNERAFFIDESVEKRALSSSRRKRNHDRYLYTEVLKDQLGETPYYRVNNDQNDLKEFTLHHHNQEEVPLMSASPKRLIYKPPDSHRKNYNNSNHNYAPRSSVSPSAKIYLDSYKKSQKYPIKDDPKEKYSYLDDLKNKDRSKYNNDPEPFSMKNTYKYKEQEESPMQNYLKYKNRNKSPERRQYGGVGAVEKSNNTIYFPKKYDIYERKTPIASDKLQTPLSSNKKEERENYGVDGSGGVSPIRRKNYKYL